jgi:hypothetical protein
MILHAWLIGKKKEKITWKSVGVNLGWKLITIQWNGDKPVNELNGNKINIFRIIKWSWGFSRVINTIQERMKQEKLSF